MLNLARLDGHTSAIHEFKSYRTTGMMKHKQRTVVLGYQADHLQVVLDFVNCTDFTSVFYK